MNALTYGRVSTEEQASPDAVSLGEQKRRTAAYVESRGWSLLGHFEDPGASGSTRLYERTGGAALLDRVRGGGVDVLVFAKLDRFTRSLLGALSDLKDLDALGVGVVFLDLGVDTSTPTGRLIFQVLAAFGEFERERIRERMTEGRAGSARRGRWSGGRPPFGYRVESGHLVVNEDEASTVRRVINLAVAGRTPWQIAETLEAEGRRGRAVRRGGVPVEPDLRHGTIGKWLTESTWYRGDGVSKTHGSESFTIPAPALVDAALFDRASEVYAENRAAHSYGATWTETDNGLKVRGLRYGVAGRILHEHDGTFSPMEGATRKGTRRYACQTNRAAVSGCRGFDVVKGNRTKSLPAAPVEYVALGSLLRVLGDPEELARLTADHEVKNDAATGGATPADLRSRLSDLGGERVRLVSHAARAGLSDEALDEFLAEHDLEVGRVSVALELAEHETRRPKPQTTSSLCSSNGRSGFRLPARSADGPTRPRAMRSAPGSTTSP